LLFDVGNPDAHFVSVEERYRSNILVNDANTASAPASVVTNLRASTRLGRTSLFGGIGNLFDEVYDTSVSINAFGDRYFDPAAGRTFYVGVELAR
jgi:iron complex outermembrane recepter protein